MSKYIKVKYDKRHDGGYNGKYDNPTYLEKQRISQLKYWKKHPEAREARRLQKLGKNNPNWKGVSSEREKIYHSYKYRQWRLRVLERDKWICQRCGQKHIRIEAHHVKSFDLFHKLRFIIRNGIALCKKCHSKEPKGWEIVRMRDKRGRYDK